MKRIANADVYAYAQQLALRKVDSAVAAVPTRFDGAPSAAAAAISFPTVTRRTILTARCGPRRRQHLLELAAIRACHEVHRLAASE